MKINIFSINEYNFVYFVIFILFILILEGLTIDGLYWCQILVFKSLFLLFIDLFTIYLYINLSQI